MKKISQLAMSAVAVLAMGVSSMSNAAELNPQSSTNPVAALDFLKTYCTANRATCEQVAETMFFMVPQSYIVQAFNSWLGAPLVSQSLLPNSSGIGSDVTGLVTYCKANRATCEQVAVTIFFMVPQSYIDDAFNQWLGAK